MSVTEETGTGRVAQGKELLSNKMEAAFANFLLAVGIMYGLSGILIGHDPSSGSLIDSLREPTIAAILLFGVIEIPRMRDVGQTVKLLGTMFLAGLAVVLIQLLSSGLIRDAAPIAILFLFLSTMIVAWMEQRNGTLSIKERIADHGPYFGILAGVGIFGLFAL